MIVLSASFPTDKRFWLAVDTVLVVVGVCVAWRLTILELYNNQADKIARLQEKPRPGGQIPTVPPGTLGGNGEHCDSVWVPTAAQTRLETNIRSRWDQYLKRKHETPPTAYCLWQCGLNQCCNGGLRTIEHFSLIRDTLAPGGFDGVTLATQGTIDRMDIFEEQARRWPGPKVVVFAVYNHTANASVSAASQIERLKEVSRGWKNTKVRIVTLEHYPGIDAYSRNLEDPTMTLYPVNTLRNVVVDEAPTNWVFPLDIDFVPSATLYHSLLRYHIPRFNTINRAVFVIPHFEILTCKNRNRDQEHIYSRLPLRHSNLADALLTGEVVPFHVQPKLLIPGFPSPTDTCFGFPRNRSWPQGVGASNYSRWYYESSQQWHGFFRLDRNWVPEAYLEKFWEPFLIARKVEAGRSRFLPRYSESYVGRYRNKVSWIGQLRAERYNFFTLLQEFTVHAPHPTINGSTVDNKVLYRLMHRLDTVNKKNQARQYLKHKPPPISAYDNGWRCRKN